MTVYETVKEDIAIVFDRDPAARSRWEILTCYPGLHAIWFHRVSHWLWIRHCRWLGRLLSHLARWFTGIEIHPGAMIGRRFFIDHGMGVVIGETTEIEDDVTLYHGVTLGGTTKEKEKRHPTLKEGVIVGAGAKVLGAITIGEHSRIGANSVVFRNVPPHSTVVGIPGCVVGAAETIVDGRVNLDHHLMPDPIARAIEHMLHLIDDVNTRVDEFQGHSGQPDEERQSGAQQDIQKEHRALERFLGGGGI